LKITWKTQLLETIKKSPQENLLGGWLILFLGVFILSVAAFDSVPKLRAYHWVDGTALVVATDMYQRTRQSHAWCGRVSYTYIVNGRSYKGSGLSSSIISDVGCDLEKTVVTARLASMPAGSIIKIYYDPTAPERVAMVREGLKWHDFFFLLLGIMSLTLGGYCIVQTRRILRQ
jgi:hypothetical protein